VGLTDDKAGNGATWNRCEQVALSDGICMKVVSRIMSYSVMMVVIGGTVLISAQSPDQQENLFACSNRWNSCNSSAMAQSDKNAVAKAKREQNTSECENSWTSCNRSTPSTPELTQVDIAVHRKLVSDCCSEQMS